MPHEIRAAYFDLGGVYYTEGFREGLFTIARKYNVDEEEFYRSAADTVFSNGYVRGEALETEFWEQLAESAGTEANLFPERETILSAFKALPGMPELVARIRDQVHVGLLTDQCNWLYELDERDELFIAFDTVVNSYEEGFTKRDMEIFRIACQRFGLVPEEVVFFDDNSGNVNRANEFGMRAFLFEDAVKTEIILAAEGINLPPIDSSSRFQVPGSTDRESDI